MNTLIERLELLMDAKDNESRVNVTQDDILFIQYMAFTLKLLVDATNYIKPNGTNEFLRLVVAREKAIGILKDLGEYSDN